MIEIAQLRVSVPLLSLALAACRNTEPARADAGPPSAAAAASSPRATSSRPASSGKAAPSNAAPSARWPDIATAAGERCPLGMVFIEGATFTMGAADPEKDPKEKELAEFERVEVHVEERPAHTVKVEAFCIDRTEVTAAAYNACVDHDGCARTSNDATTMECTASKADRQNHPINCIMWTQANDYCTRHGFVLPTEQQWEYAARGKDKRWYPWGGSRLLGDRDQDWCHAGTTCPVGSYPKARSPLGLDDMAGNVAEWTSSPFCTYPKEQCPEMDREKTYRASGFKMEPDHERVTGRRHAAPDFSRDDIGFRCAARPKP